MARQKTYDSKNVLVIFAGVPFDGFAAGSRITMTPNAQRYTKQVGSDGEVTRSKVNDRSYTAKLSLHRSSLGNNVLTAAMAADDLAPGGITQPFFLKDLLSGTTYTAKNAWVQGDPENNFEAEAGAIEWTLDMGETIVEINGMP